MKRQGKSRDYVPRLRGVCFELDAFAYLLRVKGRDELPPLNMEEINFGTGRILERMIQRLRKVITDMEEADIAKAQESK